MFFPGAGKQLHYEYAHYVYPNQMSRVARLRRILGSARARATRDAQVLMHFSLNQGAVGLWCFVCAFFCAVPHRTAYVMCLFPWLFAVSHFVAIDCAPERDLSTNWSELQIVILSAALVCEAVEVKFLYGSPTLEVAAASLAPFCAIAVAAARKTATHEGRRVCGV